MSKKMRRGKQELTQEETIEILKRNTSGTLALLLENGYTYSLPISYVYDDGKIYMHCAKVGQKLDAIRYHDHISFSVVDRDDIVPEKFTTFFGSAVVFGKAKLLETEEEIRPAIYKLAKKYSPDESEAAIQEEIKMTLSRLCIIELGIDYMTGKIAIELVK